MNDWMDKLESELSELAPRRNERDLVAAALCAHRDSQVLTARRLSRELTAEELESAFAAIEAKYPGVIAGSSEEASALALAFVQTPSELRVEPPMPATQHEPASRVWWSKLVKATALLVCFAGGIGIGLRSGSSAPQVVNNEPQDVRPEANNGPGESDLAAVEDKANALQPQVVPRRVNTVSYGKSSLTEYSRAYHRRRLHASL